MAASWTAEEHTPATLGGDKQLSLNDKGSDIENQIWCDLDID